MMFSKQWSLIVFTLAAQTAVGLLLVGLGRSQLSPDSGTVTVLRFNLLAAAALLMVATGAATLHLGKVGSARHAIRNLRTSWLSREVLLMGLLTGWVCLGALQILWCDPSYMAVIAFLGIAVLIGIALIFCMSKLYLLPTVPSWNRWSTPAEFYTTALLLGLLGHLAIAGIAGTNTHPLALERLALVVLAAAKLVLIPLDFIQRTPRETVYQAVNAPWYTLRGWTMLRLLILAVGTALVSALSFNSYGALPIAGLVVFLSAEILGRYLFYTTFERVGF